MNSKEHIDRLFQEKLEGFEATPNPEVWNAIEAKLTKKKRRVLPMWWLYSGVASILILGFIAYPFFTTDITTPVKHSDPVVTSPNSSVKKNNETKAKVFSEQPQESMETTVAIKRVENREVHKNQKEKTDQATVKKQQLIAYEKTNSGKILEEGFLPEFKKAMKKIFPDSKNQEHKTDSVQQKDSVFKAVFPKKDFIAEIDKNDSIAIAKNQGSKWSLSPVFALTHTNSFTQTSSIDKSLTSASTDGNNTFSYGVKVAYQIDKKWDIQSGVFVQKIGYTNPHLSVLSNVKSAGLQNIDYSAEPTFLVSTSNALSDVDLMSFANIKTKEASLQQNYSYIEVPVEIKYTVLDNEKFSSKLVTGFSSLFLNQNEVLISSETQTTSLGKANNLNTVNFSGNLGIDLQYSITKKLKFAVNPMFKIQLNTFSKNSNGFKPYTIGVYSGIIYQF